ncbi:MAG: bis(5'-nucleosyl)-tetraphosphatase (symmetrical) ApaH [Candidatus Dasytiphilus stammeri]
MSTYLIGDVHGYYNELCILLNRVSFNPKKDILWLTGDLVARGPNSLKVLRYVKSLENSVRLVLGNHDLNLIALSGGNYKKTTPDLEEIINSSDADDLIDWLRHQPLLQIDEEKKIIMSHAGIYPKWDLYTAKQCAREVELILASNDYIAFINSMYNSNINNIPNNWNPNLKGMARWRFITNVLTRMRYCYPQGQLDLVCKDPPSSVSTLLKPWFSLPNQIISLDEEASYTIIFGHWAALNGQHTPQGIIGLDTGCCWGGSLTMLCWEKKTLIVQSCSNKNI